MEKFIQIRPNEKYKEEAIQYIQEFYEYNSDINGVGGLNKYLEDYEGWLKKLEEDRIRVPNNENVPSETYFLVRERDNRIVGMVNIRLALNERYKKFGGNIGYSIRPTERRKGYNKLNLYMALVTCQKHGIKEVILDCDEKNLGSQKTMEALGGVLIGKRYEEEIAKCIVKTYKINVNESIRNNKNKYEKMICNE